MRILADNFIKTATITPLTEATGYEFSTALKDTRLSRIARTTSDYMQYIDADLGSAKAVDYCGVLEHNLTSSAIATIQGFEDDPLTDTTETMYLPLEINALDYSGNDNDGTATDIIYSDTPDMRMYLPLTADVLDDSDFGNDGTATDITYGADGAIFNGTSSRIVCGLSITNIMGWSIDFKFKHAASLPAGPIYLFGNYVDANNRLGCYLSTDGNLYFINRVSGSAATAIQYKTLNLCDGNEHYVHINFIDSTHIQITVDNSADTVKVLTVALSELTSPIFTVGSLTTVSSPFLGTMKNFRAFNRNLTTAEITQLYTYNTFTALSKAIAVFYKTTSIINLGDIFSTLVGKDISFKIKINRISTSAIYLTWRYLDASNYEYIYITPNNGVLSFQTRVAGDYTYVSSEVNVCDGVLHTITIKFISSTDVQFIIDDSVGSIKTTSSIINMSGTSFYIGYIGHLIDGCISDFYIFNRNLTTAEISNLYLYNSFSDFADTLVYSENIILKEFTASQSYRYWRLRVSDPTNTDNYISMSKFYLGTYIQLPYMAKNQKIPTASTSSVAESNDLQAYGDPGVFYRYGTINFPNIEDADYTIMDSMFRLLDKYVPFILLIWENDLTFFPPLYSIITSDFDWTRVEGVTGRKWSLAFNFKETF